MTGLLADGLWPLPEPSHQELPAEAVVPTHDLQELQARREYDAIKQSAKARAERLDRYAGETLEALLPDIAALLLKPETQAKYRDEFARFRQWCASYRPFDGEPLPALPACAGLAAVYLLEQHVAGASYGKLRLIAAAISDAHQISGHGDPTGDILVRAALAHSRRNRGQFKQSEEVEHEAKQT